MNVKHIEFEHRLGLQLAEIAMDSTYGTGKYYNLDLSFGFFLEQFEEEVQENFVIPKRFTLLHKYLEFIYKSFNSYQQIEVKGMDLEYLSHYVFYLKKKGYKFKFDISIFDITCDCKTCMNCVRLKLAIDKIHREIIVDGQGIIQAAFHILIQNKPFLRHMHEEAVSVLLEHDNFKEKLQKNYPGKVKGGIIERPNNWPVWLKQALLFRDKGVCVVCRKDLSGIYNAGSDLNIDHIVPLESGGNNDPTNLQLMCEYHNKEKSKHSSLTTSFEVPLWDLVPTPSNFKYSLSQPTSTGTVKISLSWDKIKIPFTVKNSKDIKYIVIRDKNIVETTTGSNFKEELSKEELAIGRTFVYQVIANHSDAGSSLPSMLIIVT